MPNDNSRYVAVKIWRGTYIPVDIAASIMLPAKNQGVDIQLNYYCTFYVYDFNAYEMIIESVRITATEKDKSVNINLTLSLIEPMASNIIIMFSAE
jgi:hypothetical protein